MDQTKGNEVDYPSDYAVDQDIDIDPGNTFIPPRIDAQKEIELERAKQREETKEILDTNEEITSKAQKLAQLIKKSKYFTAFTGAGLSTAAGIPDYRGPNGRWTMIDEGRMQRPADMKITSITSALPTKAHMALTALQNHGYLKHIISQNCDGLHVKSGILSQNISELHGNANIEICDVCGTKYVRDFDATTRSLTSHKTGRKCSTGKCEGDLSDTIINFGDYLNADILENAWDNTRKSDLMLVLGTSCRVSPAKEMPEKVWKNKNNVVIVNRQRTPLDNLSAFRIGADCDQVLDIVMKELGLEYPKFIIHRKIVVSYAHQGQSSGEKSAHTTITLSGVDANGVTSSFIRGVVVTSTPTKPTVKEPVTETPTTPTVAATPYIPAAGPAPPPPPPPPTLVLPTPARTSAPTENRFILTHEPFTCKIPTEELTSAKAKVRFMGHYNEPQIEFSLKLGQTASEEILELNFDPEARQWTSNKEIRQLE